MYAGTKAHNLSVSPQSHTRSLSLTHTQKTTDTHHMLSTRMKGNAACPRACFPATSFSQAELPAKHLPLLLTPSDSFNVTKVAELLLCNARLLAHSFHLFCGPRVNLWKSGRQVACARLLIRLIHPQHKCTTMVFSYQAV